MDTLRTPARSEAGIALVILLVVVLAVAVVGLAMADNVVREAQIAINQSAAIQARYVAEAGIAAAAAQLNQSNTWVGPITQALGTGSYTVRVDTAASNTAVKSIVSTGQVLQGALSGASQTIRETVLVLPQAFSKPMVSNTIATISSNASGATPTVQNTVLRQLGSTHANNLRTEATSVSQGAGTTIISTVTASSGTISLSGTCLACAPANNQPTIPFPTFNWNSYITLAQNNASPCPAVNPTGTFFASVGLFHDCELALTPDSSGFRTFSGIIFVQDTSLVLPDQPEEQNLKINGTLIVYTTSGIGPGGITCSSTQPCGDLNFNGLCGVPPCNNIIFTAQNGEPAVMVGGNVTFSSMPGIITITGLVYMLNNTSNPTVTAPTNPGYSLLGSSSAPVTIQGMVVGNRVNNFNSNSLTYDPSVFFPGLPSGLIPPAGPFVLLPLSWSSGK